jgi:hypothetical protein
MSHTRRHIIAQAFVAFFADADVRAAYSSTELAEIDSILAQSEVSRRDIRKLFAYAESAAFSDD